MVKEFDTEFGVRRVLDGEEPYAAEVWKGLAELGVIGTAIPEAYGGTGLGMLELCVVAEELGRACAPVPFSSSVYLAAEAIKLAGSEAQKGEWLPKVSSGEVIAAYALTEPETGSDAANIAMTARRVGEGWVLEGEKSYISNGTIADMLTVFARTGEEGPRGISAFIVRGDDPGLSVAERIEVVAPHPLARLKFDGVRAELLGSDGEGFRIAMQTLNLFRVTVGAAAVGFASRALDEALNFATSRKLGDGTLADNAVTQDRLGEMATSIDASALLIARAAWQQDKGKADNRRAAAMAKLHATEEGQKVIDMAVQMHGGIGMTDEFDIGFFMKRARAAAETFGDQYYHTDRFAQLSGY